SNNSTEISNNSENELQELLRNIAEENKIDISDELLNSYANAVANIYKTISKDSEVTLSDTIELKNKKSYIFDIGIKTKSLGHDIYLAIKLLPLKREARLSDIPEFIRAIDETRAKGIVICNSGFSKELIKYAYDNLIDLCVLKDAQSKDWSDNIEIPVVWVRANPIFFPEFVMSVLKGDTIPVDLISTKLSYNNGKNAFTLGEVLIDNWENGDYPKQTDSLYTTVFKTRDLKLNINNTHDWRKIDLLKIYYTTRDEYFIKYIQPKVYKAIENYISKDVEFTDIEMKIDYLDENREWKKIGEDMRKDFSKGDDIELPDGLYIFATTTKESLKFANVKTSDLNIRKMIKNKKK
ncbi:MAG: hypothetical protein KAS62_12415, partial [Candidatus Delongbacteria bacterium]|nr:hypothetical protein [Candidatus Delongbacteria bacterium]